MSLHDRLRDHQVPGGHLSIAWLGQAGFLVKSPEGKIIALDPYLTNSLKEPARKDGFDMDRQFPPPIEPRDLAELIDAYVLTHTHQDHLDPETLAGYRSAGGQGPWIAPAETVQRLHSLGVAAEQIQMVWPNRVAEVGDLKLRATFAVPFAGDDLTHVGYLISVANGPAIYFTGDTAYEPILHLATFAHQPKVLVTVINGCFRNLGPAEAAELALRLNVTTVIPCHYDLFLDNCQPPQMLHSNLKIRGIGQRYLRIDRGALVTFNAAGEACSTGTQ